MSTYKRGRIYWYKFMWLGNPIRESTKQGNDKVARNMEAAHRTRLAEGLVGIREQKPIPTLAEFTPRVQADADAHVTPGGALWYKFGINALNAYRRIARLPLDQITSEIAGQFATHQRGKGLAPGTVNSQLRVLRRVLSLAEEWSELDRVPKIRLLPNEGERDHVVTPEEEARYLAALREPGLSVATVLFDTGLRPDECYRLRWTDIDWNQARYGTLRVRSGKSKAARRVLPLTPRVRATLEARWTSAGRPMEGWVWPSATKSGHLDRGTLKRPHAEALAKSKVRPFVLYSARHTFLTRLGASGVSVWTLAQIAGHSSIQISKRYVHTESDTVIDAMDRLLSGHNSGHSRHQQLSSGNTTTSN